MWPLVLTHLLQELQDRITQRLDMVLYKLLLQQVTTQRQEIELYLTTLLVHRILRLARTHLQITPPQLPTQQLGIMLFILTLLVDFLQRLDMVLLLQTPQVQTITLSDITLQMQTPQVITTLVLVVGRLILQLHLAVIPQAIATVVLETELWLPTPQAFITRLLEMHAFIVPPQPAATVVLVKALQVFAALAVLTPLLALQQEQQSQQELATPRQVLVQEIT